MKRKFSMQVGTKVFTTKKAVTEHVRGIINRAHLRVPLGAMDECDLLDVLSHHPHWDEKFSGGCEHIEVRINIVQRGRTRGLWIKRIDGTYVDISWPQCLTPKSQKAEVNSAARVEVDDQILAVKDAFFSSPGVKVCPILGCVITSSNNHVHHREPEFKELLETFLADHCNNDWGNIEVVERDLHRYFKDRELAKLWQEYHLANARLQVVSPAANMGVLTRNPL